MAVAILDVEDKRVVDEKKVAADKDGEQTEGWKRSNQKTGGNASRSSAPFCLTRRAATIGVWPVPVPAVDQRNALDAGPARRLCMAQGASIRDSVRTLAEFIEVRWSETRGREEPRVRFGVFLLTAVRVATQRTPSLKWLRVNGIARAAYSSGHMIFSGSFLRQVFLIDFLH
ncbi:hypothetical protein PHSY_003200 [Pseudozyma hubeiensis SY62]|uniref:Uncharacterized protein n=1 Tax=Pseudozyma hubeiensis (strain SY62) TaxID=1305764 RepID=R9P2V1_PSEHS|nr:hypothetical protein PHSY_003200 [Pseudozyma hubeiensis SY62]GAC95624.1 hypothetical protein PHSY_003200 [Pseudozyma hubeiensis SY62]